jgi:hypothetical protein
MRRIVPLILLLLFFAQSAIAREVPLMFEGEPFTKKFIANSPNGDKLIEFVRENESFEKWTKLIGYRYQQLPGIGNDPIKAAVAMDQILKTVNPKAQSMVFVNDKTNDAIIDFLIWPSDGKLMEFNVFHFVRSNDGNAVVSLQLTYRFTDITVDGIEKFKKIRQAWITQAGAFDMKSIHDALGQLPVGR